MYYTVIENDFKENYSTFKIIEFDFKNEAENCILEKVDRMPVINGITLEPIMGMLSVYFYIDEQMNHDYIKSNELSFDDFLRNTFV